MDAKLLKSAAECIATPLTHIINLSLCTVYVLTSWKTASVCPIHKVDSKSSVSNYRPISILPIMSKILQNNVHEQLYNHLTVMIR